MLHCFIWISLNYLKMSMGDCLTPKLCNSTTSAMMTCFARKALLDQWDLFLICSHFVILREDFTTYADVCFRELGDRVAYWTTFNEPNIMSIAAYDSGFFPPQRCTPSPSASFFNCTAGNSSVEPYIVTHYTLLAHASAARLYKEKYQVSARLCPWY